MMNTDLAICIPTYNRASILDAALTALIPQARRHNIPIYISDNASTDMTAQIVAKHALRYPHLYYSKNAINVFDDNFEIVLKKSSCRYSWLLSDDERISDQALPRILAAIAPHDFDMIILNGGPRNKKNGAIIGRVHHITTATYTDHSKLLTDIGWHMQWISGLIFSKKVITGANFDAYRGTNLMQFGVIFDYLARGQFKLYWIGEPMFYPYEHEESIMWRSSTLRIFAKNWYDTISSLPDIYSQESKLACIKGHGVHSGLFSLVGLAALRETGALNYPSYKEYEYYLPFVTNIPRVIILLIALTPIPLLHILKITIKKILRFIQR
jgi:abequosyltransferase